jgi:hypothetical protein
MEKYILDKNENILHIAWTLLLLMTQHSKVFEKYLNLYIISHKVYSHLIK